MSRKLPIACGLYVAWGLVTKTIAQHIYVTVIQSAIGFNVFAYKPLGDYVLVNYEPINYRPINDGPIN